MFSISTKCFHITQKSCEKKFVALADAARGEADEVVHEHDEVLPVVEAVHRRGQPVDENKLRLEECFLLQDFYFQTKLYCLTRQNL